jgi:hypothetical protein
VHINLYCPMRPHAGLKNVLANSLACLMLVSVCLLDTNLNAHAKPENKLRP